MNKTLSASDLSERLRHKTKQDREQIETLVLNELQTLSETLKQQCLGELNSTEDAISRRSKELLKNIDQALNEHRSQAESLTSLLARAWIMPTVIGLSLFLGIFGASWGLMRWTTHEILSNQEEIARQSKILAELEKKGGRINLNYCGKIGEKQRLCAQIDESEPSFQGGFRILKTK